MICYEWCENQVHRILPAHCVCPGGVPVHVMEVVGCPAEGAPERAQSIKVMSGLAESSLCGNSKFGSPFI